MSSVSGLKARPSRAIRRPTQRAEVLLQLADDAPLLQLVDLDHRVEELEVVAGVAGQHLQGADVLGEAAAAVADPGAQEGGADPLVEAHPAGDLGDVGADLLADVGDLVDEGDLGREEGVGGELDHLGAGHVGADQLAAERRVERGDGVARLLVAGVGADHDPVGIHEVGDRGALLEELGAGDVGAGVVAPDRRPGPGRHRALHDQRRGRRRRARRRPRAPARGRRRRRRSAGCRRRRRAGGPRPAPPACPW